MDSLNMASTSEAPSLNFIVQLVLEVSDQYEHTRVVITKVIMY